MTSFLQEACSSVEVLGKHHKPPQVLNYQEDVQNLTDYFKRPRLISRGALALSSIASQGQWDMTYASILSYFPQAAFRLSGVYGVKATLCFRLQVASTPFHQGLLALNWQYSCSSSFIGTAKRANYPGLCTNLPHVRLDLSESTMCELKVPYMSWREFWSTDAVVAYGLLALHSILPIAPVVGINAPTYELYMHWEDIEFYAADSISFSTITPQSGKMVKRARGVEAKEADDAHLLSDSLSHGARIARFVTKNIPSLAAFSTPTAWALDTASGVARFFGFSKPQLQEPPVRMVMGVTGGEQNVDLPSTTQMLGLMASNTLGFSSEFSHSDVDEMALEYVLGQYSQICAGNFAVTDAAGAALYGASVSPCAFWYRQPAAAPFGNFRQPAAIGGTDTTNAFLPSHAFWWASLFRYWRGGFRFRISFAKTKHHGGRVLVTYNPGESSGGAWTTVEGPEVSGSLTQPFGYSAIFDLRDTNVLEFDVPYTSGFPYQYFGNRIGSLSMVVLDPLQAPSVVAQVVPFLVEVKCLPGFELADYSGMTWYPHLSVPTIKLQSGKLIDVISDDANQLTVGESIKSAKQLIMSPVMVDSAVPVTNTTIQGVPWWFYSLMTNTTPIPPGFDYSGFTHAPGAIASCYSFARGSTDYHIYPHRADNIAFVARHTASRIVVRNAAATVNTPSVLYGTRSATPGVVATAGAPLHVRFPAFSPAVRLPTYIGGINRYRFAFTNNAGVNSYADANPGILADYPTFTAINSSGTGSYATTSFCAGDDAALGMYIGPPPLALPLSNSTAPIDADTVIQANFF